MTARPGILDDDAIAIGPEPDIAAAVAIMVHGHGRSPVEMRNLAIGLASPLFSFVIPAALADGAWYPESFLAPIEKEPALTRPLSSYGKIVDAALAEGVVKQTIFDDRAHEVCEEEMVAARELLAWWTLRRSGEQSRRANN